MSEPRPLVERAVRRRTPVERDRRHAALGLAIIFGVIGAAWLLAELAQAIGGAP